MKTIPAFLLAFIVAACIANKARSADSIWDPAKIGAQNFNDASNWLGGVVPQPGNDIAITTSAATNITLATSGSYLFGDLILSNTGASNIYAANTAGTATYITITGNLIKRGQAGNVAFVFRQQNATGALHMHIMGDVVSETGVLTFGAYNSAAMVLSSLTVDGVVYQRSSNAMYFYSPNARLGGLVLENIPAAPVNAAVSIFNAPANSVGGISTAFIQTTATGAVIRAAANNSVLGILTIDGNSGTYTYAGTLINGSGTLALSKIGANTQILSGLNSYTGDTTISGGVLLINGNNTGATGAVGVLAGGALGGSGAIGGAVGIASGATLLGSSGATLTMLNGLALESGAGIDITLGAPGTTPLFNVSGGGGLVLDGLVNITAAAGFDPGTYRLFNYTGGYSNNGLGIGIVSAGFGTDDLLLGLIDNVAGQVDLSVLVANPYWTGGNGVWSADVSGVDWENSSSVAGAWLGGRAVFRAAGGGTVTVDAGSGGVGFTGMRFEENGYVVEGAPLAIDTGVAHAAIQVGGTDSGATVGAVISSVITGAAGIGKTGLGTLTLGGANTYSGATTVRAGTLLIDGDSTAATGALNVLAGATLGGAGTIGGAVTLDPGATLLGAGGQTLTMNSGLSLNTSSTIAVTLGAPGSATLFDITGALDLNGLLSVSEGAGFNAGTYRLFEYTASLTGAGLLFAQNPMGLDDEILLSLDTLTNPGAIDLVVSLVLPYWRGDSGAGGAGAWSAAATGTSWQSSAAARIGAWQEGRAVFGGPAGGAINVDNTAGQVKFTDMRFETSGYHIQSGSLTITPDFAIAAIQVGGTGAGADIDARISSIITGNGGINKTGLGTLVLDGANTYTGATSISAGRLCIDGNHAAATGAVNVLNGGALGGIGTLGGAVSVASGGVLLGKAGQVLAMNAGLALDTGSIIDATFGAPNTTGLFNVTGGLALNGTINISELVPDIMTGGSYRIFDYTGALTGAGLSIGALPSAFDDSVMLRVDTSVASQVNLNVSFILPYWRGSAGNGGTGTWSLAATATNWQSDDGARTGEWQGGRAVFRGPAAGTVTVDNSAGQVTFTDMRFDTTGYQITGGALQIEPGSPTATIQVGGADTGAAISAIISTTITGDAGLIKTGLGTLQLTGASTYGQGTQINAGTVRISNNRALGAGAVAVAGGATLAYDPGLAIDNAMTLATGIANLDVASGTAWQNGVISGGGGIGKTGAGTLVLSGNNSARSGMTRIASAGGALVAAHVNSLGSGDIVNDGLLGLRFSGVFANAIAGDGHIFISNASIDLANTGAAAHTFTGQWQIESTGTVRITGSAALGGSASSVNIAPGGALDLQVATGFAFTRALTGGGLLSLNLGSPGNALTFTGAAASSGFAGTVRLTNGAYNFGNTALSQSTLALGANSTASVTANATLGGLVLDGGTLRLGMNGVAPAANLTVTGSLGITNPGASSVVFLGYTGDTIPGTLPIAVNFLDQGGLTPNATLLIAAGSIFTPGAQVRILREDGTPLSNGQKIDYSNVTATYNYALVAADPAMTTAATGAQGPGLYYDYVLTELAVKANSTLALDTAGATGRVLGASITGNGGVLITSTQGAGDSITLAGGNTYTGITRVANGSKLVGGAAGVIAASSTLVIGVGATFDTGGFDQTVRNLTGAGDTTNMIVVSDGSTLAITGSSVEFMGSLVGTGNLTLTPTGTRRYVFAAIDIGGLTTVSSGYITAGAIAGAVTTATDATLVTPSIGGDVTNHGAATVGRIGGALFNHGQVAADYVASTLTNHGQATIGQLGSSFTNHGTLYLGSAGGPATALNTNTGLLVLPGATPVVTLRGRLHNTGMVYFDHPATAAETTLEIDGLSGSGTFHMGLALDTGKHDKIHILGDATGGHTLLFSSTRSVADTDRFSLRLVQVDGSNDATFSGTLHTPLLDYVVQQGDGGLLMPDTGSFYLAQTARNRAAQAIIATAGVIGAEWNHGLETVQKRLGDLRANDDSDGSLGTSSLNGAWIRASAWRLDGDRSAGMDGFSQDTFAVNAGADTAIIIDDDKKIHLGGFIGMNRTSRKYDDFGDGSSTGLGAGIYITWLHENGWYADAVFRYDQASHKLHARGIDGFVTNANYTTRAQGGSIEAGRRMRWGWLWVEPGAQVAMSWINKAGYTTSNNIDVTVHSATAVQYGFKLTIGANLKRWIPHVKIGRAQRDNTGGTVHAGGFEYVPRLGGTRYEFGAGAAFIINPRNLLYLDYEYNQADDYTRPWAFNLGYRHAW